MKTAFLALVAVCAVSAFVVQNTEDVVAGVLSRQIPVEADRLTGEALVEYVNKVQTFYKAKFNPTPIEKMKERLMDKEYIKAPEARAEKVQIDGAVPDAFDSRTNWPKCSSMNMIRDQSNCGSCWAFGAAEAMTDRVCVANNGASNPLISSDDLLSCCGISCGFGCSGGYPIQAWRYWQRTGIVTGGNYADYSTCRPYEISPCGHHPNQTFYRDCPSQEDSTPKCTQACSSGYPKTYPNDKIFGKSAYAVQASVDAIQKEIMTYGPVEAGYTVYEDFYHYTTGVYVHTGGAELGGHAVKILGWGVDGKTPYWLVANSWNTDWGEQGYFRIIRGTDECGIEDAIVAGLPA